MSMLARQGLGLLCVRGPAAREASCAVILLAEAVALQQGRTQRGISAGGSACGLDAADRWSLVDRCCEGRQLCSVPAGIQAGEDALPAQPGANTSVIVTTTVEQDDAGLGVQSTGSAGQSCSPGK